MSRPTLLALLLSATLAQVPACPLTQGPRSVAYPADPEAGEVAFRFEGPGEAALTVPVEINGAGPFAFVLDTGATLTCVDQALADSLALPVQRGAVGAGATVGGSGAVRLVRLDSLRLGGASAEGLPACVLDLAHIGDMGVQVDGLLGLNFLRRFDLALDFRRNVLTLAAPDAPAAPAP
ncbi:MAG: retropepsin-like aspartic protease [Rubricoccaceae bacterium]